MFARSTMTKLVTAAALAISFPALAAPAAAGPQQGLSAGQSAAIDRVVANAIASRATPGAVVGVARGGEIVFLRGYGMADLEHQLPMSENGVFRIGSVTKQFTAAAIMRLQEQGRLSIDDPLARYFPDFPRASEVTLRQLLSHTAGLREYAEGMFMVNEGRLDRSPQEMMRQLAGLLSAYDFDPGTAWGYSNTNYVALAAVIERVTGEPYAEFIRRSIIEPAGLAATAFDEPRDIVPGRVEGYETARQAPGGWANDRFLAPSAFGPAGAMRSTAPDLIRWHAALFGGRLLRPESLAAMTAPARLSDGRLASEGAEGRRPPFDYGLGFIIDRHEGRLMIGHGGGVPGFNAWVRTFPEEDVTIVVLTNSALGRGPVVGGVVAAVLGSGAAVG